MESLNLRGTLLKLQDRLSDDDRKRLHFFLGNDVPRRIRDDSTLGGTLCLLESLFDQDKINEDDLTFLINAFDEIQCTDAAKALIAYTKQIPSNDLNQSIHSLSSLMPFLTNEVLLDQSDKYSERISKRERTDFSVNIYIGTYKLGLLCQTKDSVKTGMMSINENIKSSPVTVAVNNQKKSFSSLEVKQLPSFLSLTQKCLVVLILLLIILAGFMISCAMKTKNLTAEYNNITKENTKCREKVQGLIERQTTNNEVIQNLTNKTKYLEGKLFIDKCSIQQSADENANVKTKQILAYIGGLPKQGKILSGQFAGHSPVTFNTDQIDEISRETGQVPAILGCDYADGSKKRVPPENIIDYSCNSALKDHWNKGGLVTVNMHLPNPVSPNGSDYDNRMNLSFADLTNSKTKTGKRWHLFLDRIAEGLNDLQGAGVTVLYHPLHQMNGDWFYWSNKDPNIFQEVWRNMFDYFINNKNLHNILWVFSPPSQSDPKKYYPGDPYVDIVALDVYTDDPNSMKGYDEMINFHKPFALGEVGPKTRNGQFDYTKWITAIQSKFRQITYFLAWNNDWSPIKNQNANTFFNDKAIINRGSIDFSNEITFSSNEVLYNFSNGIGNWIGAKVVGNLYQSKEFIVNSTDSLKAVIDLTEHGKYSLYTQKQSTFNVSGRKRLTAYTRVAPWGFENNGKMMAKFYLKIGPDGWKDEGEVQLNSNTATVMSLNLCQLSSAELNDIREIGVLYESTAKGGRSAIYLSSIFVQ